MRPSTALLKFSLVVSQVNQRAVTLRYPPPPDPSLVNASTSPIFLFLSLRRALLTRGYTVIPDSQSSHAVLAIAPADKDPENILGEVTHCLQKLRP